ncbi:MAG: glycosyl transferase, partial [Lachnospiraceae bacterium]|nr:glycosyl transferase [Lachnospiraceae bacterium]
NVIIQYRDRPEGSVSKLNTYSDGFKVLRTIARLFATYRPLGYFGIIAGVLFAVAVGFFIPVFTEYIGTGLVPRFPTLIACGFLAIAAIQSLFAGLILNNIYRKSRQDFEIRLYQAMQEERRAKDAAHERA